MEQKVDSPYHVFATIVPGQTDSRTCTAGDSASHVAEKLRELADEHYDNSALNSALLLGADLIDFQGKKIDLQSKELELLGMENNELRAQVARVKDLLSGQRKILEAMPERDRAVFKAFQVFILDVFDALGEDDDAEDDISPSAAEPTEAEPIVARPRKAEREGALVTEMLTKVFRLQNQGKMADAAALRETIPKGKVLGASALNKAAIDLERRLFCVGGYASIEALVDRILQRPLVRQVLCSFKLIDLYLYLPLVEGSS